MLCHLWFAQHSCLHLTAVDTAKAVEVQEHWHVVLLRKCHTLVIIGEGDLSSVVGHGGIF